MLRFLSGKLPESRAMKLKDEFLSSVGRRWSDEVADFQGMDDLVARHRFFCDVQPGKKTKLYLARALASAISERGDKLVAKNADVLAPVSSKEASSDFLIVHQFSWSKDVADRILEQGWGRLGKERKNWLMSDDRSLTGNFGLEPEFLDLFVNCDKPLYLLAERLDQPIEATVFRLAPK